MSVRQPTYRITYDGTDITEDVSQHLKKLQYDDFVESASDDLALTFEDKGGLWKGSWYPETGAQVIVEIGYEDEMVEAGEFDIDQLEATGPPDEFILRALATGIGEATRTRNSRAYENHTLRDIAEEIAGAHGLTVQGQIDDLVIERVTQNRQTDLAFLANLASEYGYVFSIRGDLLVFEDQMELEQAAPIAQIDKTDMTFWSLSDRTTDVYAEAELRFTNPELKEVIRGLIREGFDVGRPDALEMHIGADNVGQAERKAQVALYRANSEKVSGLVTIPGRPGLVAGINVEMTGMNVLSGIYHVKKSSHTIDRAAGYSTTLDVKRVEEIDESRQNARRIEILVR